MEPIPYSQMRPLELMAFYNEHAKELGEPTLKRPLPRCRMVERLALIRTRKPPKKEEPEQKTMPAGRGTPIRDAAIKHLTAVAYYVDSKTGEKIKPVNVTRRAGLTSHGFSYQQIVARMRKRFPKSRVSIPYLHVECSNIRKGLYGGKLPDRRPRSNHRSQQTWKPRPRSKRPSN